MAETNPFRAMLEVLGPNGENWGQFALKQDETIRRGVFRQVVHTTYCLVGSMDEAITRTFSDWSRTNLRYRLASIIGDGGIESWNDASERRWPEVRAVLERAADEWDVDHPLVDWDLHWEMTKFWRPVPNQIDLQGYCEDALGIIPEPLPVEPEVFVPENDREPVLV